MVGDRVTNVELQVLVGSKMRSCRIGLESRSARQRRQQEVVAMARCLPLLLFAVLLLFEEEMN